MNTNMTDAEMSRSIKMILTFKGWRSTPLKGQIYWVCCAWPALVSFIISSCARNAFWKGVESLERKLNKRGR